VKGQFMALTAVLVSVIVLSMTGAMTQFQNQNYPLDDTGRIIDTVQEEAGKVEVNKVDERESFREFMSSIPNYRTSTSYDATNKCFDVTMERKGDQITLECVGGNSAKTEKVQLISIGLKARQSEGGNAPIPPGGTDADYGGVYDAENGRQLHDGSRSYGMSVYDLDTNSFQYHRNYDVYGNSDEADQMAQDIEDLGNDQSKIVLITTQDEPQSNRLHGDLPDEMYDLGASEDVYGASSNQFVYRSAYVLVGRPGLGEGNAYLEKYKGEDDNHEDSWVDVNFELS